jgi:hypothetical protein
VPDPRLRKVGEEVPVSPFFAEASIGALALEEIVGFRDRQLIG